MSFDIPVVHKCPIATGSIGRMEIDPDILAMFAGAVHEPDEWLAVLLGERTEEGLHVTIEEVYVPRRQKRSHGACSTEEPLPPFVTDNLVGVVHSHHTMGAFFSSIDTGKNGLNQRFPSSIVLSSKIDGAHPQMGEFALLGFAYQAEGRFNLPCGGLGVAQFKVVPIGVEDWPFITRPVMPQTRGQSAASLGDCGEWSEEKGGTKYMATRIGSCGVREAKALYRSAVFGVDRVSIPQHLPPPEIVQPVKSLIGKSSRLTQKEYEEIFREYRNPCDYDV
jgi:proteasome lid subunit RPN8/RPN11